MAGVLITVLVVDLGGWLATRSVVNQAPRSVLN
jgi:hypothetical protein